MSAEAAATSMPFRGSAPFLSKAAPLWLPLRHFVFAAGAFWAFAAAFAWGSGRFLGFDLQARWVLGLTHVLTLGWVTMTLFGALCQLAPVLWETPLAAPGLAKAAWWLFGMGLWGFVGTLWLGTGAYAVPAALLVCAVLLYLYVFTRTMLSARLDWTGRHLALAAGYLAAVVTLGLLLAFDRGRGVLFKDHDGALIAHVHLALVGWVSLSIVGVSYRLVSMFALSSVESKTPGRLALALANAGLLGLATDGLFLGRRHMPFWATLLAGAYFFYFLHMRRLFTARPKRIDPPLAFTLLALVGGAAWAGLGLALAWGRLDDSPENRTAYAFCALLGWATPFILGQAHKIVPFLVWLHVYSPRNWKPPVRVPTIADLTSGRLAWAELAALAPGVALGVGGFLAQSQPAVRASAILLLTTATLYAVNTGLTLSHILRKDPQWTCPDYSVANALHKQ